MYHRKLLAAVARQAQRFLRYYGYPVLAVFIGLGAGAGIARAQALGSLTGSVTDPSGAAVPNAKVTATESGTGFDRSITTDAAGRYIVPSLRPTDYVVTVEAAGFRKYVDKIRLEADQTATVNVQLQLGPSSESIEVSASASNVQVDVATPTLTEVVGTIRIEELPLNGRAVAQLINLVPGAVNASPTVVASQSSLPGSVQPSINGSRNGQTGYLLDGAPFLDQYYNTNLPFPFPDSLQEFSVQTNNYSSRYGGNSGGVVNVVTKSGTNSLHGALFEFNRNQAYNARNAFTGVVDTLHRNDFGGTLGGPVYIPRLYNGRDHTFFFFSYQGTRYVQAGMSSAYVPTDAQRAGDLSAITAKITDPLSGTVFPGNQIPASRMDPASVKLMGYLPRAGGNGFIYYPTPRRQNIDMINTRIDHEIGQKDRIFGRIYRDKVELSPQYDPQNILVYDLGYDIPAVNYMVQETHTFRPNLLNQVSFVYNSVPVAKIAASNSPNMTTFGVQNLWQPETPVIQSISVNGYFSVSGGAVGPFNASSFNWQDDVTWIHGGHDISFGGNVQKSRVDLGNSFQAPGSFTFTADQVGNALGAFLIGKLRTFRQGAGEYKNNRNVFPAFYITDTWHAQKRLTLTLGMRYEPYSPWDEVYGRVEQFRVENYQAGIRSTVYPNAPAGLLFPGDPGMPSRGTTGSMKNFAPRAGLAWAVTPDGRTSLRSGFGMFYDTQTPGVVNNRFASLTPFSPQITLTPPAGPFSNPTLGVKDYPFPFTYPPSRNAVFPAPVLALTYDPRTNFEVPVSYSWNLTLERQVARDWLVQAAYVGSHGSHAKTTVELNPAQYIPGSKLGTDQRRIFQGYGSIAMAGQSGNSSYNSLQVAVKKRMAYGVSFNLAYTFSKALDDMPVGSNNNDIGADGASTLPWYFPNGRSLDYGPSGSDRRHRLVMSYVWQLPGLKQSHPVLRSAFGGWQITGIATFQTGDPMTVTVGYDRSLTSLGNPRADLVSGQPVYKSEVCGNQLNCISWLNPAAFYIPASADGQFGNVGKGALRGPGMMGFDAGLSKNFAFTESVKLQLRGEFFNAFNHVNPGNPGTAVNNPAFGKITGVDAPRIGQLGLKLTF